MWSSKLEQAERNMRNIKMHTKIWSENLKKVEDNIKVKVKTSVMAIACIFCKKTFRLCEINTSWPSALPTSQFDPGCWSHAFGQESAGMPFVRLVCAQRCDWVCWWLVRRNRQLGARWDWKFLTTRNKLWRSSVFLPLEIRMKIFRWCCEMTRFTS
jgi:hypothetical protein